uniref:Uncharacterized protein n=1 Tax=Ciona intestinalis TaxID=7719 RepID=H2XM29_CIOIN
MTGGFETFLQYVAFQTKIHIVSNDNDADYMIRRALSTCRLCYEEVSDGMDQIDQRLREVIGNDWQTEYEKRNNEPARMDKSNIKGRQ